ncbi:MAG: diacylglycerol kinase family lipid kinase [Verrucomicrobiales bacterium]|nr:diacylglycerol kinase family lipid kinase [Verrucomicrobiales bacterium]
MNPAARSRRAGALKEAVEALDPRPVMHYTTAAGHATEIARELVQSGVKLVIAAGGDGTMNETLQGVCRANAERAEGEAPAAMGTLPLGTMNVFAAEMGLPGRDLRACWQRITSGERREVDLWMANDLYFVQLGGVGLDAEVIRQTTWEDKMRFGPLSYALSALRVLRQPETVLTVHIEGRPPIPSSLVLIGNGRRYGGPLPVFRQASNSDGLLDILVFHHVDCAEIGDLVRSAAHLGDGPPEGVQHFQLERFEVRCERDAAFELDGELAGVCPVRFAPASQRLIVAG